MRTKSINRFLPLVCLLIVSALFGTIGAYTGARAKVSAVDISTTTTTNYIMKIPTNSIRCYWNAPIYLDWPNGYYDLIDHNYKTPRTGTVIVTFNKVLYEGAPVMITGLASLKYPPLTYGDKTIEFHSDIQVNIRESYYRYFTETSTQTDWANVSFMFVLGNNAYAGAQSNNIGNYVFNLSGITLEEVEKPGDTTDPNDPNFELGDNGGINTNPERPKVKWLEKLYNWCIEMFGWKIRYETFSNIVTWSLVGAVVLFTVALLMSVFKRK